MINGLLDYRWILAEAQRHGGHTLFNFNLR